ncbi:MAG: SRPBCC family protein [Verrucomicrobiales bacterium]|nr:SRPBCC family protein [Verrucomicrobiales bacterium]
MAKLTSSRRRLTSSLIVFAGSGIYALLMRVLFGLDRLADVLPIVSLAFLIFLPIGLGALVTFLGYRIVEKNAFWIYAAPALTILGGVLLMALFKVEAVLCIVVALPVMAPLSILGGWIISLILKKRDGRLQVSFLALLPLAIAPLESKWEKPHEQLTVIDTIDIDASADTVWSQIASVPRISTEELPFQWIYLLDFPKPVSAEIDREEVGGRRLAVFEREVTFFEVVTEWNEGKALAFTIEADPEFIPHTAFDQHIIVGGRFYDVLDGRYEIDPLHEGGCRLHLTSTHRLSTPFNSYAGWWSEWVMRQVQGSILDVIKTRCEAAGRR